MYIYLLIFENDLTYLGDLFNKCYFYILTLAVLSKYAFIKWLHYCQQTLNISSHTGNNILGTQFGMISCLH